MFLLFFVTLFSRFQSIHSQTLDANGVSLQNRIESIERLLLTPFTLDSIVSPCSLVFDFNPASGEQTSAEWIRIVFHDFVTADVAAGTGGLDGSISFESDRAENTGIHFVNSTIQAFSQFYDVETSVSDLIGLGLADSFMSCDTTARFIKLRAGRVDANGPGPSGVPGPTDSLAVATAAFAKAGFDRTDMIQAVACGHSVGSVHEVNFPDIVQSAISPTNTDGASHFDSTFDVFDNTGVNEYLNGTGLKGGPLVVGANHTTNSDLRIFSSDGNATIEGMTAPQAFEDTCFTIFERMLDTVPKNVALSDPIVPRAWVLRESHLDLTSSGGLNFSGTITTHSTSAAPATASYFYANAAGASTGDKKSKPGGSPVPRRGFGNVTDYSFSDIIANNAVASINIANGVFTRFINRKIFILVSQSFLNEVSGAPQYMIRAAVLSSLSPTKSTMTATQYFTAPQTDSVAPTIKTVTASMTVMKTLGAYTVYQAVLTPPVFPNDNNAAKPGHFDVKLGTTQRSAKVVGGLLGSCSKSVLTNC